MNEAQAQMLAALQLGLQLSLPVLGVALAAALAAALLTTWTRTGEQALSAIPRALATLLVLGSAGRWMASELVTYAGQLFRALPELVR